MAQKTTFSWAIENHPDLGETIILRQIRGARPRITELEVGIAPHYGSNMFRLRWGENTDLIFCDPKEIVRNGMSGNFVMWPFPNRVAGKRWREGKKTYSLEEVETGHPDPHLIHGLVRQRKWRFENGYTWERNVSVTTSVEMRRGSPYFECFPFPARLTLTYLLKKNQLWIRYKVENLGEKKLPFGFGLHPLFSTLPSGPDATSIMVRAHSIMQMDRELLPTGELIDISNPRGNKNFRIFNLESWRKVNGLTLDHVYTRMDPDRSAVLDHTHQGIRIGITASPDFTHCVVYTMQKKKFVCIEHQTCSVDAHNLYEKGIRRQSHLIIVEPGKLRDGYVVYTIR
jgi:aldose 1-epimerase